MNTERRLLTTTEAAARAGITPAYVRLLALMGKFPYQRIGPLIVVEVEHLDAWNTERKDKSARRLARVTDTRTPEALEQERALELEGYAQWRRERGMDGGGNPS